jgi:uncharacterized RDD family membrane protein YckC
VAAAVLDWLLAAVAFLLLVDLALVLARVMAVGVGHGSGRRLLLIEVVAAALVLAALAVLRGGRGTPGMRLMRLVLVREQDGQAPGTLRAFGRCVVFGLTAAFVVGAVSPLFDSRRRGWHDLASGTWLLERPAAETGPRSPAKAAADAAEPPLRRPVPPPPLPPSLLDAPAEGTPAVAATKLAPPDLPPDGRPDRPAGRQGFLLVVGDRSFPLAGRTLVGRDPAPADGEDARCAVLRIEDRSLSKTHALLEVDGAAVYVTDRWSLNGTTLVQPGGPRKLAPGERVGVPEGASIRFGRAEARVRRGPA